MTNIYQVITLTNYLFINPKVIPMIYPREFKMLVGLREVCFLGIQWKLILNLNTLFTMIFPSIYYYVNVNHGRLLKSAQI